MDTKQPEGKSRGGRPRQYANNAARQAAYRARKGRNVGIALPEETKRQLDAYIERQHRDGDAEATLSSVIDKLLQQQLFRRR